MEIDGNTKIYLKNELKSVFKPELIEALDISRKYYGENIVTIVDDEKNNTKFLIDDNIHFEIDKKTPIKTYEFTFEDLSHYRIDKIKEKIVEQKAAGKIEVAEYLNDIISADRNSTDKLRYEIDLSEQERQRRFTQHGTAHIENSSVAGLPLSQQFEIVGSIDLSRQTVTTDYDPNVALQYDVRVRDDGRSR